MGKEGVEPSRIAARDPKSRLSANSSTSPEIAMQLYVRGVGASMNLLDKVILGEYNYPVSKRHRRIFNKELH